MLVQNFFPERTRQLTSDTPHGQQSGLEGSPGRFIFQIFRPVRCPPAPPSFVSAAVFVLFGLEETPEEIIFNIPS